MSSSTFQKIFIIFIPLIFIHISCDDPNNTQKQLNAPDSPAASQHLQEIKIVKLLSI
jgi:hypothetical protein